MEAYCASEKNICSQTIISVNFNIILLYFMFLFCSALLSSTVSGTIQMTFYDWLWLMGYKASGLRVIHCRYTTID